MECCLCFYASASRSKSADVLLIRPTGPPVLFWYLVHGRVQSTLDESSNPDVANLYQMWVAPNYRGLSAGQMLLESVIAWASAANMCYLVLNVTCGDSPALRLYVRAGFQAVGEPEPLRPGSELLAQPMRLALRMGV